MSGLLCRPCNSKTQHFLQATVFWNFRHRLVRYYWYQLIKMKQRFLLHLDGDLGCGHDIGMTSWKLHLDGGKQIFSTQAWLRHEFRAFLYMEWFKVLRCYDVKQFQGLLGYMWLLGRVCDHMSWLMGCIFELLCYMQHPGPRTPMVRSEQKLPL